MTKMTVETEEGKAITDALVILNGYCLHRISVEGTGRHKLTPADPRFPNDYEVRRTPEDFIRRSTTHLLERFRELMKIPMTSMYEQGIGAHKVKGAYNR